MLTVAGIAAGTGLVVVAEQRLSTDAGRAVVIAVAVAAGVALVKWVWKAILRQLRTEVQHANQPSIDEMRAELGRKIDDLSARNDEQHKENGDRLGALEEQMSDVVQVQKDQNDRLNRGSESMRSLLEQIDALAVEVSSLRAPARPA